MLLGGPPNDAGLFAIAIIGVAMCALVENRKTRWAFSGQNVS